nr:hypothetical protein CFP56_48702 [Quercus suber]
MRRTSLIDRMKEQGNVSGIQHNQVPASKCAEGWTAYMRVGCVLRGTVPESGSKASRLAQDVNLRPGLTIFVMTKVELEKVHDVTDRKHDGFARCVVNVKLWHSSRCSERNPADLMDTSTAVSDQWSSLWILHRMTAGKAGPSDVGIFGCSSSGGSWSSSAIGIGIFTMQRYTAVLSADDVKMLRTNTVFRSRSVM